MKSITACVLALLGAAACAEDAAPGPAEPPGRELLMPRDDVPGVGNFAKVSDVLFRGEQPTAEGMAELKKMGIKTVINLRAFHSDRDELKGTGLNYVHIYCKAWHPEEEDVLAFLKVVSDPKYQPVFVHCQHGADRTGMMCASYRIVKAGWAATDAAKETHNFGFHQIFKDIQKYLLTMKAEAMEKLLESTPLPKIDVVK